MKTHALSNPGTLIRARGREWMVLPNSSNDLLMARPLGGLDEEITGLLPSVEPIESAAFSFPSRDDLGDFISGLLLREAARISTRAAAGPFRSFARIAVEPRPYQLVPLMMALKLNPVRLLVADDVGIGKTIEAALIARELLDRGEIRRLAVLCPPHLAEQWQRELAEKFHIDAELILSSTIQRLERNITRRGDSVFDLYPYVIVSTDFIKSERHAQTFIMKCPEFVIVDEAHGCTLAGGAGRGRQQRFELIKRLASNADRHLVLVTATPHSGNESAFRSLLGLLDETFCDLPEDLSREERDPLRRKLARHLVQRRREDIRRYLETDTAFPTRDQKDPDPTYRFSPAYSKLFKDIVDFARSFVADPEGGTRRRRVRYWSALALLRCVSSSPAAAAATLRSRAAVDEVPDDEVEETGRRLVLDQDDCDDSALLDLTPGAETDENPEAARRKLLNFAKRAETLAGDADTKLQGAVREVKALIKDGFQPIVFCRFIDTAHYVAGYLREALPDKVKVESITGQLPPSEREARIDELVQQDGNYVLVCTDCLSEGINLQQHFNAVLHYDLCWNPTRHEQREGRVDRFGQKQSKVRVITYWGEDNPIDGVILDVLIRKHKRIRGDLGVTIALPGSSEQIAQTIFEGALFREMAQSGERQQLTLDLGDEEQRMIQELHAEWDRAGQTEVKCRSRFAQHTLDNESVAAELQAVRSAIGRSEDVARFVRAALQTANVPITEKNGAMTIHLSLETPRALRQALGRDDAFTAQFDLPLADDHVYLGRTSPVVEGLAGWVLDQALDANARTERPIAARCSVIRTPAVNTRTTLVTARFRYHLRRTSREKETILCEEILPLAFTGDADKPDWLSLDVSEPLLKARPSQNLAPSAIEQQMELLVEALPAIQIALKNVAATRAEEQLLAHERVRQASRVGGRVTIEPVLPVDLLGTYLLLPELP
jgi:superfamily II DNA or RNA helicase